MWKISFMKYLPPVRPKFFPNIKVFRIYWNLEHFIFRISRSRFWYQKLSSLNTYHLFGPNWSQYQKCSEFIEIWHIQYFKYANLDFNVKNDFFIKYLLGPNVQSCSKWKIKLIISFFLEYHEFSNHCSKLYSIIRIWNH